MIIITWVIIQDYKAFSFAVLKKVLFTFPKTDKQVFNGISILRNYHITSSVKVQNEIGSGS